MASYGVPRVRFESTEQGVSISRQRVASLTRQATVQGISKRHGFTMRPHRDKHQARAKDLIKGVITGIVSRQRHPALTFMAPYSSALSPAGL